MRRVFAISAAAMLALSAAAQKVVAQTIASVPDNAIAMVKVNGLEKVSKDLGTLSERWGLTVMSPLLATPVASLQELTSIKKGIKLDGEAAVIFFNPTLMGGQSPVVVMLPVADYQAFLGNFPDIETKGEISSATLPMNNELVYISQWGAFAAMSPTRDLVATKPQASKVGGLTGRELADKDIVAYINFDSFRIQAQQGLAFGQMALLGQINQNIGQDPEEAKYLPAAKAAVQQFFAGLRHLVTETDAATYGVDLAPDGIQLTLVGEFEGGSYLGGIVSGWNAPPAVLQGVPDKKYAIIAASTVDSKTLVSVLNDATAPIIQEAQKLGEPGKLITQYINALQQNWAATDGQTFAMAAPQQQTDGLFDLVAVVNGNADALIKSQTAMAESQQAFQEMLQLPSQGMTVKSDAKTLAGVSFDQITTKVAATGAEDAMVQAIDGKEGLIMFVGKLNASTLLLSTARPDGQLVELIESAKANRKFTMDQAGQKVAAHLPQNAFAKAFIYGDQVLELVNRGLQLVTGAPVQFQIPVNTPPAAYSLTTEGAAVRMDVYVPSDLVESIISAAFQQSLRQQQRQQINGGL